MRYVFFCIACNLITLHATLAREQAKDYQFKPRVIGIVVSDMETSMAWYTQNLAFERDTVMHFPTSGITVGMVHQGSFFLELVSFKKSIAAKNLQLPGGSTSINGFFKIGFEVKDLEHLYNHLNSRQVKVVAPIDALQRPNFDGPWPDKYFLVEDPDGNYVQFFSARPESDFQTSLKPFLMGLATPNLNESINWYQKQLGAQLLDRVGTVGNERAVLDIVGFILELGQFEGYINYGELSDNPTHPFYQVHGVKKLSFHMEGIRQLSHQMQVDSVTFDFELTEKRSLAGDRYFMIQDNFGNSLQFFASDKQ